MTSTTARDFELFAASIALANDEQLLNDGPVEQTKRAVEALNRFHAHTPLTAVYDRYIDLAGFGQATIHFESTDDSYALLSDIAEQLGVPIWKACKWADQQHLWAIQDQRQTDEERGDGNIGWDCLRYLLDLRFAFTIENPEAEPDARGERWSHYGEWLIARSKLPQFISVSPWGLEFMNNTWDHMALKLPHLFGAILHTDLTEEEAARKAVRGPAVDPEEEP